MIKNSIVTYRIKQIHYLYLAVFTIFMACDTITTPDIIEVTGKPLPTTLYVPSGGSALIDLTIAVNNAAQVSIAQNAKNGLLNFEDGRFIKYTTKSPYLVEGEDFFILKFDEKETTVKVIILATPLKSTSCEVGIIGDKAVTTANKPVSINVVSNDLFCNGADLTAFFVVISPKNGQITTSGSTITFTPNKDFVGTDRLIYTIAGRGFTQENGVAEVEFEVNDPNNCSISISNDAYLWASNAANPTFIMGVLDNDVVCKLSKSSLFIDLLPKYGTVSIDNNQLVYTTSSPNFKSNNFELIRYGLRDSSGATYTASVFIQLFCAAKLVDDYAEWTPNAANPSYTFNIFSNDSTCNINLSTAVLSKKPVNGVVSFSPSFSAIYTPNIGFKGLDSFRYSLVDNIGIVRSAKVKTKVN